MPDPQQLADLAQGPHTAAVQELEDATAQAAVADADDQFGDLVVKALAAWTAASAGLGAAAVSVEALRRLLATVRAAVRRILAPLGPRAQRALDGALGDALRLGSGQLAEFTREASGRRASTPPVGRPGRGLRQLADRVETIVTERRDRALGLLHARRARTWQDILTGIGAARGAVSAVRAHVSWVINTAVNEGLVAGIAAIGAQKLWLAERDACTACLAYAGRVIDVRDTFPGGLNWDPNQQRAGADEIAGPPRHPNCRCRLVPWRDRWAGGGQSLPDFLHGQAVDALANGRARPTESRAARIRAARALLASTEPLTAAQRRTARQAVHRGRWPHPRAA
ncbi:hypothetical protein [Streptomyces sp. NPDC006784]|uniref:hypothetical protein n=1 Tax=Streptomyces sp. NPDC006784 TaxID=3364764 RepID=UPI0036CCF3E6